MQFPMGMRGSELLAVWSRFDGIYECPKDNEGAYRGPLVAYTTE